MSHEAVVGPGVVVGDDQHEVGNLAPAANAAAGTTRQSPIEKNVFMVRNLLLMDVQGTPRESAEQRQRHAADIR